MNTTAAERDALYDRHIVDRARTPRHAGRLDAPDVQGDGRNPLCGDKTHLDIALDGHHIQEIRHQTRGCAICSAAADLMAERLRGSTVAQARQVSDRFKALLVGAPSSAGAEDNLVSLGPLEVFAPLRSHKARIRCAELPWVALEEAFSHVDG
ncbi:Fe-S cluster assembly sulfur transfer protein SufU [Acetobacter ghanensis]|uniref:NifU-like domain-containing protein n=1 Tax=Acetobacter ghanensis TaxID=431306 RepID=A0A0U5FZL1_9PROT|nr:SUF system NifU family Fe-S cluster assembly protein [Acetobacter ghanensis]NHO39239.1 SUF system NifU family Fe-S cluster assembly protein [Acetobacter ghanensis]GBQ45383.1 NifU family SUF system FeS assembly protein [Acetobacter ghanensis DSM 18895]CEF56571.1 NifU-like domain-containing protein [Acetobacter ghanensis]